MNRKHMTTRLSPVERAVIAAKWTATTWDANIHALIGANEHELTGKSGTVFYVALYLARKNCPESADARIVASTVNAISGIAGTGRVDDMVRKTVASGLQAASRVYHAASHKQIVDAACDLELKLRKGHVHHSDFCIA